MWNAETVKKLRRQLGWASADLARRLGVTTTTVVNWELGRDTPGREASQQLQNIKFQLEKNAERVAQEPVAESLMSEHGLEQITDEGCRDLQETDEN